MSRRPAHALDDEFLALVVRYLDSDLPPAEAEDFCRRLAADPDARRAFVDTCLQAKLCSESLGNRLNDCTSQPVALPPTAEIPIEAIEPGMGASLLGFLSSSLRSIPGGEFVVGVLVCAAVFAAGWGLVRLREHLQAEAGVPLAASHASGRFLATLTSCENCIWRSSGLPTQRAERLTAGQLDLASGVAEITFDSGARVVVEGPAVLRLESTLRAYLELGRVVAFVPPAATGFTVGSPSVTVVDLGTEFGLSVDAAGAAELQVFQGRVEALPTVLGPSSKPLMLTTSGSARFDRVQGRVLPGARPAEDFVRRVDVRPTPRPLLSLVEEGGQAGPGNLAVRRGAKAFAQEVISGHPVHAIEHLRDGRYGNDYSWLGSETGPSFAGIDLGGLCRIDSIAFGRDNSDPKSGDPKNGDSKNGKVYQDRCHSNYIIQFTTVEHPDERTDLRHWRTIDTVKYDPQMPEIQSEHVHPWLRHRFRFNPVMATGVRIAVTQAGVAIDELEVYGTPLDTSTKRFLPPK